MSSVFSYPNGVLLTYHDFVDFLARAACGVQIQVEGGSVFRFPFSEFARHCEHRTLYELPGSSVAAGHRTGKEKHGAPRGQMWEDVKWQPNPCIVRAWGVVFLNVSGSGKAETKKIQSDLEVPISYNSKPG